MNLDAHMITVLDTETTGFGSQDRIVELAAVTVYRGAIVEEYGSRVNPEMAIPPGATAVHGITDHDVKDAPTFAEAFERLAVACRGRILCAYNAPFDRRMILQDVDRCQLDPEPFQGDWLDPYVWARKLHKFKKGGKKLADICPLYEIRLDNAHSALDDAKATAQLMLAMAPAVADGLGPREFLPWQEKRRKAQDQEYQAWKARQNSEA